MSDCRSCKKPMRPKYTNLTDYPGTVARSARGLCGNCYRRSRLKGDFPEVELPAHLQNYLARRRPYRARLGIPAEGVLYAGEK